jgi:hypothetical protein
MEDERPPCVFCQRVRIFSAFAIVIVVLLVTRTDIVFLSGIDLNNLLFKFVVTMFVGLVIWKIYQEYWLVDKEVKGEKD